MQKRGQLGIIEMKYFMVGFLIGIIAAFILVALGSKKVLPFKIPIVCGPIIFSKKLFQEKKAQLIAIEFHFFMAGLGIGLIAGLALIFLGTKGIIPFRIPVVCG